MAMLVVHLRLRMVEGRGLENQGLEPRALSFLRAWVLFCGSGFGRTLPARA